MWIPDAEKLLFEACKENNYMKVLEFLIRGVDTDFPFDDKKTGLLVAIEKGIDVFYIFG